MEMKAIVLREFGGPDVLSFETVAAPVPQEGEVLVKVEAVSVNRTFDVMARAGAVSYPLPLPVILGADPSGEIVGVGEGVDRARIGEKVFISRGAPVEGGPKPKMLGMTAPGGYAQYVTAPAFQAQTLPNSLDPAEATIIYRHALAAYSQIRTADVKPGDWVLVMGAAGGVGSFLIQMAKLKGAKVIAVASSQERVDVCLELGADFGINYKIESLTERVMEITEKHGVDVVFENISDPDLFPKAFASLAKDGRLLSIGYHGGGVVPVDMKALHFKRLKILSCQKEGDLEDIFKECVRLASEGKLRALIGARLPLSQAAEGHRLVEEGLAGKVILEPQR